MRRALLLGTVVLAAAGCGAEPPALASRGEGVRDFSLVPIAELRPETTGILARPEWVSMLPDGRIAVADLSDKDIEVYDAGGRGLRRVGRPGHGPGEFTGFTTGLSYRDSLVGYDLNGSRISFFAPDGRFTRALDIPRRGGPRTYHVRVVDDSLFLLVGAVPGGAGRNLLSLVRPDGSRVSSFFNPAAYLGTDPKLIQSTGVTADGAGGVVFAALMGGDSVYAFDYAGRRLGAGPADPAEPLVTTRTLLERSGGREWTADRTYFSHGNRNVIGAVALDSATVALQIAPYDAVRGTDPVEGGTMVVLALREDGSIRPLIRSPIEGGLLGRDRLGRLLVLQYVDDTAEVYRLSRVEMGAAAIRDPS